MGRPKRADEGGIIYHVLNRANARITIFEKDLDYAAYERVLEEAVDRLRARLLAFCAMPSHWHLIVWPRRDCELSRFVGWLRADPHPAVARRSALTWQRPRVSGAVQVIPGPG
jgi:putative transposase